jgi:hypothetical protein
LSSSSSSSSWASQLPHPSTFELTSSPSPEVLAPHIDLGGAPTCPLPPRRGPSIPISMSRPGTPTAGTAEIVTAHQTAFYPQPTSDFVCETPYTTSPAPFPPPAGISLPPIGTFRRPPSIPIPLPEQGTRALHVDPFWGTSWESFCLNYYGPPAEGSERYERGTKTWRRLGNMEEHGWKEFESFDTVRF